MPGMPPTACNSGKYEYIGGVQLSVLRLQTDRRYECAYGYMSAL